MTKLSPRPSAVVRLEKVIFAGAIVVVVVVVVVVEVVEVVDVVEVVEVVVVEDVVDVVATVVVGETVDDVVTVGPSVVSGAFVEVAVALDDTHGSVTAGAIAKPPNSATGATITDSRPADARTQRAAITPATSMNTPKITTTVEQPVVGNVQTSANITIS
jgi:hypothetical protein